MDLEIYVGQSGQISNGICENHEYFIISLLFVQNKGFVEDVFKKSRLKAVNRLPELKEELKRTNDIKGLKEKIKTSVYRKIFDKCGLYLELSLIIMDNMDVEDCFRQISQRAFNYILRKYLDDVIKKGGKYGGCRNIKIYIDETKTQTKSKFILEEYLNTELNLFKKLCSGSVQVSYCSARDNLCIQLSDYFANTEFRDLNKKSPEAKTNLDIIKESSCKIDLYLVPALVVSESGR